MQDPQALIKLVIQELGFLERHDLPTDRDHVNAIARIATIRVLLMEADRSIDIERITGRRPPGISLSSSRDIPRDTGQPAGSQSTWGDALPF